MTPLNSGMFTVLLIANHTQPFALGICAAHALQEVAQSSRRVLLPQGTPQRREGTRPAVTTTGEAKAPQKFQQETLALSEEKTQTDS